MEKIKNFAIIAHVDHGKSTLADRLLELTGTIKGIHDEQMLDRNPISRKRGITIKLAPVRMEYSNVILNLIDTPGHVDFSYEVDRTLSCVEGVVLLVDATQGIQAQTVSNAYKAIDKNLTIIPVINKIDLPSAEVEKTKKTMIDFLGIKEEEIFKISAKTGQGVKELPDTIIKKIPQPTSSANTETRALIFDSYYDSHKGVIAFVRIFSGSISKGQSLKIGFAGSTFIVNDVGIFNPDLISKDSINEGEIGYVVTNLKNIHKVRVGDTILNTGSNKPLPGYKKVNPMVFASIFTVDPNNYTNLKRALEKLYLNDSSLEFTPIYSKALGAGFRVGFLGLLHADVVRERLEREYELDLVLTPPQVEYKFEDKTYLEPIAKILILTPEESMASIMKICMDHRAKFITMDNISQVTLSYGIPFSELISDLFSKIKSASSGFASLDWEFLRYEKVVADKLEILLNDDPIEEFSEIVVFEKAQDKARILVDKLKDFIPKQQYEVKIQAKYKGKIIASQRITPFRKDVTAKLYGGDRTRKDKLLSKQKKGKKKMKMVGRVEIPKDAFFKLFKK